MWVCNICRKQQELLTKTGAWYHGDNSKMTITLKPLTGNESKTHNRPKESIEHIIPTEKPTESLQSNEIEKREANPIKSKVTASLSKSRTDVQLNEQMIKAGNEMKNGGPAVRKAETVTDFKSQRTKPDKTAMRHSSSTLSGFQGHEKGPSKLALQAPRQNESQPNSAAGHVSQSQTLGPRNEGLSSKQAAVEKGKGRQRFTTSNGEQRTVRHSETGPVRNQVQKRMQTRQHSADTLKQNSCVNFRTVEQTSPNSRLQLHGCHSEPNISENYTGKEAKDHILHRKYIFRQQHNRRAYLTRDTSVSSSEDDVRSTTEYSSFDDGDKETSISDNDFAFSQRLHDYPRRIYRDTSHHFDHHLDNLTKSSASMCSCHRSSTNTRDSGVESSAPYADLMQQEQLPVSWQPSSDGRFLIGHLLLHKNISSTSYTARQAGALLGLKVVGGKSTPSGRLGAFITKVKKGSLADTIGHLKPGDEIISWNKHCLQDASFDEVYEIILHSKEDVMVELVVSRPIKDVPRIPETRLHQTAESSSCSLDSERRDYDNSNVKPLQGRIQIRIWYDDNTQQLYVTAIRAVELSLREGGLPRNPYLKMYLLPDRSNTFKRRTKTAKKTLSPEWLQTFVYGNVRREDLGAMALELTLWDYDRSLEANNKFMGEVMIDLGLVCLDDEPHWFRLMPLGYGMNQDYVMDNHSSYHGNNTSSMSSENNFTDDRNNNHISDAKSFETTEIRPRIKPNSSSYSLNTLPKRRLPNVPSTTSQSTLASRKETKPPLARAHSVEHKSERERTDDSFSSKTSMEFDAVSVDRTLQTFVGGIGPGQIVGRQALALTSVGEIELGLYERRSLLEVQVIRARKLVCKPGSKVKPAHYVKIYMMLGMQCTSKKKTKIAGRSLNPSFHQTLVFDSSQPGNALQVIVWGDYGRMDNKVFVGMVQIALDELDLRTHVLGWYKLFPTSSIIDASNYGSRKESYSSFGGSSQTIS